MLHLPAPPELAPPASELSVVELAARERIEQAMDGGGWLPRRPLATDDFLAGMYRMGREQAKTKRYVEANPKAFTNLLIVDVDHGDATLRLLDRLPGLRPNLIVENPITGNAHAVWWLRNGFPRTEFARQAPIRRAALLVEGLRRKVDGDKAYGGLMTKNPLHVSWATRIYHEHRREFDELGEGLNAISAMPPVRMLSQRRWRVDPTGLGRNCALFSAGRHFGYREMRYHWGDPDGLYTAIEFELTSRNAAFSDPLPVSEVRGIARSITRWIVTKSRMWADGPVVYAATFSTIQAARGRKSGVRKAGAAAQLRSTAAGLLLP